MQKMWGYINSVETIMTEHKPYVIHVEPTKDRQEKEIVLVPGFRPTDIYFAKIQEIQGRTDNKIEVTKEMLEKIVEIHKQGEELEKEGVVFREYNRCAERRPR